MSFTQKTWKDRISEYPTRRTLTDTTSSAVSTVTVAREEGTISQEGDAFSATNMNDLESRIAAGITKVNQPIYHATYTVVGWTPSSDGTKYSQTQAITGMTATTQLMPPTTKHTGVRATDEALDTALGIINAGVIDSQAGAVLITVWEKPVSDIDVYWSGKETA